MAIKHLIRQLNSNQDSFKLTGSGLGVRDKLSKVGLDTSAKSFRLGGRTKASSVNLAADRDAKTTTQAVNNAIGNGDVMLMDTRQVYFRRPVTRSAINIYNPRKVEIGAGSGGSKDQTTEAEKREQELEARRRRRRMALLTGGAAGGAAAGSASDSGGGGGDESDEESLFSLDTALDALGAFAGVSALGGVFKKLLNFRKSIILRGAVKLAGVSGLSRARTAKTTAPKAPTPKAPAPKATAPKATPKLDTRVGRYRDPVTGRFTSAPKPTPTVKPSAATRFGGAAKAVGSGVARGAGMVTRLAGGPVGVALIAAELIGQEYIRRLQESTEAQNIANASHARRRGNAFFTSTGQPLGEFSENDPGFVRSIVQDRANLVNNTLTVVGVVRGAKEAFLVGDDTQGSIYLKSIEPLLEERARIAGRLGGVMLAENMISSPGEVNILGRLSPGSVGGIDFNVEPGLDQEVQRDLDLMRKSQSMIAFFDKKVIDNAKSNLRVTDTDLILETTGKRRQQYESAKAAQGIESTPSMVDVAPPTNGMTPTGTATETPPVIINNQSAPAPSPPLPETKLDTRGDEARDIRDLSIGNGQMTGGPGID